MPESIDWPPAHVARRPRRRRRLLFILAVLAVLFFGGRSALSNYVDLLCAVITAVNAVRVPRGRWLVAAILPAGVCYIVVQAVAWYVSSFIVKPNELVREKPYIVYNTDLTRQAYGLNRVAQREFPAETTIEAADPANNQATLQNVRLWDWHALQDTLLRVRNSLVAGATVLVLGVFKNDELLQRFEIRSCEMLPLDCS